MTTHRKQIRLTTYENEPLARLAEQRLRQDDIPCVVGSLGVGTGGWGSTSNLPHAIYVKAADEMRAREVLDLDPAEIAERGPSGSSLPSAMPTRLVLLLIVTAAALAFGVVELLVRGLLR